MIDIFEPLSDRLLVIFDNVLILAASAQENVDNFAIFLDRCNKYRVILKFDKTWIGFLQVKFFGYICKQNKLYPERFKVLQENSVTRRY